MVQLSHPYMTTGKTIALTRWTFVGKEMSLLFNMLSRLVKNLPAMQETWVQSLGWEDPLEKGKATHSRIPAWRIPWTIQSRGSQRVGHDWVTFTLLSRFIITFLPRSKCLLISWLQSPAAVILEPKKIKSLTVSIVSPSICHEVMVVDAMILVFWMLSFKPTFSLSSSGKCK